MMFTRKPGFLLAVAALLAAGVPGCQTPPDPNEYGETITEVPARLNKPFPLPDLGKSGKKGEKVAE